MDPQIPKAVSDLTMQLLKREPCERPKSALSVVAEIDQLLPNTRSAQLRLRSPSMTWFRTLLAIAGMAALLIAAFAFGQRMDFIHDNALHALEHMRRVLIRRQQSQTFRRGQQDMGRVDPLAFLLRGRGVAGAVLDADWQADLIDRSAQVALDIRRQRLERRDIDCVQPRMRAFGKFSQRRQKPRHRLAAAGRGNQQVGRFPGPVKHLQLMGVDGPAFGCEPGLNPCGNLRHGRRLPASEW